MMRLLFVVFVYGPIAQAVDGVLGEAGEDTKAVVSAFVSGAVILLAAAAVVGLLT